jgi:hypothetical protein
MDAIKIVVYYLEIESLISLYVSSATYRNFLESKEALFTLSKKFNLKQLNNFDNFVEQYDRKYLTKRCFKYFSVNKCLKKSAKEGNIEIVIESLKKEANDYNGAMSEASGGGHKEIVQMMLNLGADGYNKAMANAARCGHKEIVQMMIDLGACDYDWAIINAAIGGHKEIVRMMLDLGANDYNLSIYGAASGGHKEIVQMIKKYAINNK